MFRRSREDQGPLPEHPEDQYLTAGPPVVTVYRRDGGL
jgi:hypothetical protein